MKTLALIIALLFATAPSSVYDFKLKTIDGKDFSLAKYKGKKSIDCKHSLKMRLYQTIR